MLVKMSYRYIVTASETKPRKAAQTISLITAPFTYQTRITFCFS